jgi:predicted nucleotidyltransferase
VNICKKKTIDLTPEQLAEIRRFLAEYLPDARVRAYGSRVNGNSRQNSDLDLIADIDKTRRRALNDIFGKDELPIDYLENIGAGFYIIQEGE